jgi:hypothetical protein
MSETPEGERIVERLVNDLAVKITEHAIMELDADEENTLQMEAFGNAVEKEIVAALASLQNRVARLEGWVEDAYLEGYSQGASVGRNEFREEHWANSKARAALAKVEASKL